jgi:hypothetical protein
VLLIREIATEHATQKASRSSPSLCVCAPYVFVRFIPYKDPGAILAGETSPGIMAKPPEIKELKFQHQKGGAAVQRRRKRAS